MQTYQEHRLIVHHENHTSTSQTSPEMYFILYDRWRISFCILPLADVTTVYKAAWLMSSKAQFRDILLGRRFSTVSPAAGSGWGTAKGLLSNQPVIVSSNQMPGWALIDWAQRSQVLYIYLKLTDNFDLMQEQSHTHSVISKLIVLVIKHNQEKHLKGLAANVL